MNEIQSYSSAGMMSAIKQMLERANEQQLRNVYFFIRSLMGGKKA